MRSQASLISGQALINPLLHIYSAASESPSKLSQMATSEAHCVAEYLQCLLEPVQGSWFALDSSYSSCFFVGLVCWTSLISLNLLLVCALYCNSGFTWGPIPGPPSQRRNLIIIHQFRICPRGSTYLSYLLIIMLLVRKLGCHSH